MNKTKVAIIGTGPAGYTAAIYASRAQLEPIVFSGLEIGGQLMYTTEVENYPGFPDGIVGPKLMMNFKKQAERFGAVIRPELVTAIDVSSRPFKIWTNIPDGVSPDVFKSATVEQWKEYEKEIKKSEPVMEADSIVISTGASPIMLGLPGEKEFLAKGVSACAVCDAAFFKDKNVFVVGGGDSAMEDALALTKFATQVTIIHRRSEFRASKIMRERVLNHPKITVLWNSNLKEIMGSDMVESIKVEVEGEMKEMPAEGVFMAIGHRPVTNLFKDKIDLDGHGYIITRQSLTEVGVSKAQEALNGGLVEFPSMTSVDGVFAAGDVVDVRYKQAVTAAGQGCSAALDAERWLESNE